jgi:hypothetical protein
LFTSFRRDDASFVRNDASAAWIGLRRIARGADSGRFREAICAILILVLATVMLAPVVRGDWPVGHDHPVHLFRIWQLEQTIRQDGLPWTWSHRWFAGYPQNVVYPIGADLLVVAVHAVSFGLLKIGQAYGIAFWLFYAAYGYAVFYFVRQATGSRVAGLIATLFSLTDPGSNEVGGWFWVVDVGVWTSVLGLVPALIGTVKLCKLLEKPGPSVAASVGLCFGLALLCHQIHFIFFGLVIPLLCLSRYLAAIETDWRRAFCWLAVAVSVGLCLAGFWYVPYAAALPYAREVGARGRDLAELGDAVAAGTLFPRMHFLAIAFGLIGSIGLLRTRRPLAVCSALFIIIGATVSSSTFASLFGGSVDDWMAHHITADRIFVLIKPFWYGAAGFAMVGSWRAASRFALGATDPDLAATPNRFGKLRRAAPFVLGCIVALPLVGGALHTFYRNEIRRPTMWHSERRDEDARQQFIAWTREALNPLEFGRIAHGFDFNDHDLTDLGIDVPYPFYKVWPTPTGHFKYDINDSSGEAFRAVNVRFALAKQAIDRPDFTLEKIFNQKLWLYRFRDWNPQPFQIDGTGQVELIRFDAEEIRLRADQTASGRLRLNVSYFPKWQATLDNAVIPIRPVSLPGIANSGFMETELRPGEYRFRFRRSWTDYAGTGLSLVGLGGCLFLRNWGHVTGLLGRSVKER